MSGIKAKQLIYSNRYMTLATVGADGVPWATPLFYVFDGNKFLWYSRRETEHSKNLEIQPVVSGVIYVTEPEIQSIYFQGKAVEISSDQLSHAMISYAESAFKDDDISQKSFIERPQDFTGTAELRFYSLIPDKMWLLGDGKIVNGKYLDYREPVELE